MFLGVSVMSSSGHAMLCGANTSCILNAIVECKNTVAARRPQVLVCTVISDQAQASAGAAVAVFMLLLSLVMHVIMNMRSHGHRASALHCAFPTKH